MIVTGALFADHAVYLRDRLYVLGGVWDWYVLPPERGPVSITLVALVQFERDDPAHLPLTVEVIDPTGQSVATAAVVGTATQSSVLGSMIVPLEIEFARVGVHSFLVRGTSGDPISVPLDIRPAEGPDNPGT